MTVIPLSLANGIVFPWTTAGFLAAYFGGRTLYTMGYQEKEGAFNKQRIAGSVIVNSVHMATMCLTMFLAYRLTRGKLDIQKALGVTPK